MLTSTPWDKAMLDARFSHLYICQSVSTLQRVLPAIAGLLVSYSCFPFIPFFSRPRSK